MLRRTITMVLTVPATLALAACASAPGVGAAAPAFEGEDAQGTVVSLGDFANKVVVLDFWATWCSPCRAASPAVQALQERFADTGDVVVLGIHFNDEGDPAAYAGKHGLTFPIIVDGRAAVKAYGVKRIPTFVVIDRSGTIVYRQTGFGTASDLDPVTEAVRRSL
jgi:cytochrome c biogenesis protein CcmG/thiol:disulfide interchange protein DsbE